MINSSRTLVLAPHTDDAEIGCGGTIARLIEEGTSVYVVAFSTAQQSLPEGAPGDTLKNEFMNAMPMLGVPEENLFVRDYCVRRLNEHRQSVLEDLVRLGRDIEPDIVILPSGHDMHQDHQVVHAEGMRAFKHLTVLGYELPWNNITFDAQAFVTLEPRHLEKKYEAMRCYESQLSLGRPYFQKEFIEGWARMRGVQVKVEYAEAFELMRVKW